MAAAKGNKNASGKHRVADINDKKLAAEVRSLALQEIKDILLQNGLTEMKKQVILKLASSVLPRLNEHSGNDGEPIQVQWLSQSPTVHADGLNHSTNPSSGG